MSCYHPLIGIDTGERTESGKVKYWIRSREQSADFQKEIDLNEHILIPCGKCIGCRLDYSRSWADRMMLELETAKKGLFITLTYNNETLLDIGGDHAYFTFFSEDGLPENATVRKRDWQLFMKRLRKEFDGNHGRDFRKIRFFSAGEYGDHTHRPHMHAILFGIGLDDFPDIVSHGQNELGQIYYISPSFSDLWPFGFSLISDVSWKTCAYVARYVVKKQKGWNAIEYAEKNIEPPFALMSRKPGLGREYLEAHPDCLDFENINLSTPEGALKIRIPKYYYKQLISDSKKNTLLDPERYDKIMADRKKYAEDSMILQLQKTGLSFLDYLEVKEERKLHQIKALQRNKCV